MIKKIKFNWQIVGKMLYGIVIAGIIFIGLLVMISFLPVPGDYNLFVVRSGSMKPALSPGDMILTKKTNSYQENDIITFVSPAASEDSDPVTHRLIGKEKVEGEEHFVTKGDVNTSPDTNTITKEMILGKYQLKIPLLGYVLNFAKTLPGLIILIIIPAIVIIYDEIHKIREELKKKRKEKKDE